MDSLAKVKDGHSARYLAEVEETPQKLTEKISKGKGRKVILVKFWMIRKG